MAFGLWFGVGCTVPSAEQVAVERLCAGRGAQALDGVLRADPKACDRGMELTVQSTGFKPGCVRVTVGTPDGSRSASTLVSGRPSTVAGNTLRVGVQLSEAWKGNLRLGAEAFEQTCDAVAVTKQSLDAAPAAKGRVSQVRLELAATDADDDGYVATSSGGTDCNDANAAIHPGATERCDGVDDNCVNGEEDALDDRTWYIDQDGDGYGGSALKTCTRPTGTLSEGGDCNDANASIHPGRSEFRCDGQDDNCDGTADEGLPILTWYRDADGDEYGDVTQAVSGCAPPSGHVAKPTDCNDADATIHPGVAELLDLKDNNCNGAINERLYPGPRMFSALETNFAITAAGTLWGWGINRSHQLGDESDHSYPKYIFASEVEDVTTLAVGETHILALRQDGKVTSWGSDGHGELGHGFQGGESPPAQIPGLEDVTALAAGMFHSVALKRDGTVWGWGDNTEGQLGDGTTYERRLAPVQARGMTGVIAIAAKSFHTIALRADGTVWLFSDEGAGGIPAVIPGLTGVVAIESAYSRKVALKADGSVWQWDGFAGPVPTQVPNLSAVTAIAAGGAHVLALKQDGTVWAWGRNGSGQLGDGTTQEREVPVQVTGLSDVATLAAGNDHSLAVKKDGSVWSWGFNAHGLIDDSGMDIYVPKRIAGSGDWN
ncbi:MopE-related protein [Corallococcus sp. bb12-1]|uniref:MopE-related protein n=1 Tax=Corallococcus sp. bb12-1 TaxID=2996784 RepID=UPI0022707DDB|nr:MopE-related protein [Corallococcus sp. bb12-1]MCY1045258.1 MopE-related protein [Corallococcus sp. bb12-1]